MNEYIVGYEDYSVMEECTIDYVYTNNGGEYTFSATNQDLKISLFNCVNTLHCFRTIIDWCKTCRLNGTTIAVKVHITEEAEQGLDTDLNDEFFFRELDEYDNCNKFLASIFHIDINNVSEDELFMKAESIWNKWNNDIKLHCFNIFMMNWK